MIVLDTNVISELIRPDPDATMSEWFLEQDITELFVTTVTEAELHAGATKLPAGRRRSLLTRAIELILEDRFSGRILPFDRLATREYAEIMAHRRAIGRSLDRQPLDCQIAAIARSFGAAVATRNVRDFTGCGIPIINPWETGGTA